MRKFILYLKRAIKYIIKESKQPIITAKIVQRQASNILENKTFIITGGGSGLGFYIAKKLINENAHVIITGRNENKLKSAKKELGDKCDYQVLDMKSVDKFDEFFKKVFIKYSQIDGIINNAGISLHEWDFMKVDKDKFEEQFTTNLKGSYFFTQSYIKYYSESKMKSGKILFISSERGTYCDDLPYGLTKASMNSLVKALSYRYYKEGININAISPGVTASNMTGIDKNGDLFVDTNSQRYFVPEEVGEVAFFLLSDYSKCVSGEIIHTNGGNHIRRGY